MTADARVTVLAVGVSTYVNLADLAGPKSDLLGIKWLFTDPNIGLYSDSQVEILDDPTSADVRSWLLDYVSHRTARGDILVFYFSGHGTVVGSGEFAFCLSDATPAPNKSGILPLSVLHFGDVMESLAAAEVHPVFIVDACYGGAAARSERISAERAMALMHDTVHRATGSSYAILCACSERNTTPDGIDGGLFTQRMLDLLEQGLPKKRRQSVVTIQDLFPLLQQACEQAADINAPRLYLGPSLPAFDLCRNTAHEQQAYTFSKYMADLIRRMWNGGSPVSLTTAQIRAFGAGAYGNHRKLSYAPWGLLEDGANSKERRLTDRGQAFAADQLKIPRVIRAKSQDTDDPGNWECASGTDDIAIGDL